VISSLETIDPIIEEVLSRNPYVTIDLKNNANLHCEGLEWMTEYLWQLKIEDARCVDKNNELFQDYLDHVE
jgi:hypothetical protein